MLTAYVKKIMCSVKRGDFLEGFACKCQHDDICLPVMRHHFQIACIATADMYLDKPRNNPNSTVQIPISLLFLSSYSRAVLGTLYTSNVQRNSPLDKCLSVIQTITLYPS